MQTVTIVVVLVASMVLFGAVNRQNRTTTEFFEARVIAYDDIKATTPCYRDCEASVIVRLDGSSDQSLPYARLDFKYQNGSKLQKQLVAGKRLWRFSVKRTSPLDEQLVEYLIQEPTKNSPERQLPIWRKVQGAENDKLPFGKNLPSYFLIGKAVKLEK